MTVVEARRWRDLFAARAREDVGAGIVEILALAADTELIPFAGGFPDPQTFPAARAAGLLDELAATGDLGAFQYAPTRGLPGTRDALQQRLEVLQGRRPTDDELLVTSGGIDGLELVSKSFLDRGDAVVVEGPTYLGAIMAFRSFEAQVVAVPMDADGLDVDELAAALVGGLRPKLLYTIPDHQNPAGVSLAAERRTALVDLARRYGFLVAEDVAYRELGFDGDALPSLWSLGPDVVVQLGTTSKTFFPGVRLGWAAGPDEVIAQLVVAKQNTDQCASPLGQKLWEEYARRGCPGRAARPLAGSVPAPVRAPARGARADDARDGLVDAARGRFLLLADAAGRHGCRRVRAPKRGRGVAVVPGAPFFPDGRGTANLRLSYSKVEDELIDDGVERLAALVREGVS